MTNIGAVIGWKHNHQDGMCTYDGVITEFPGGIPSQEDQDKWIKEYEAHLLTIAYVENRKNDYPAIEDQLDKIYHDGIDAWKADMIKPIKDKHPKE